MTMRNSEGPSPKTVDEYIERLPEDVAWVLEGLRSTIRKAAPKAEEIISYQIPTYKLNGALVHFAAFKNHCSFFVVNKAILNDFRDDLKDFKIAGTTIQFDPSRPLSKKLVTAIVKRRITENAQRKPVTKSGK